MGSGYFVLKGNDIVSIKGTTSTSPVKVSVSSIIAYGQTNNYGNAFALYDAGNSRSGVAIRFFNISGDTAYLGTVSYINNSLYIGISDGTNNNNITNRSSVLFGSTPDGNISGLPVAANFTTTSKGGITYLCNGGSVSSYSSSQAFYLPDTITNIYVDAVKYNTPTWKQIFVDDSIFFGAQGTIVDLGICEKGFNWRLTDQQEIENINQYLTGEMTDSSNLPTSETEVYRKGTYSITANRSSNSGPGYGYNYYFKIDNEITNLYFSSGGNGNKRQEYKWALAIDEANQKAAFIAGGITIDNYYSYVGYANSNNDSSHTSTNLYNWLIGSGLLGATIKVNYYLPNDEYTYAKITYKQNTSPIDQNDGDSVDIDPSLSSVNIEGLEENETYWFTIFTNKSESEAFEYTVEVDPVPPEYKTYIDNINGTGFDWIRELEQDTATITNSDRSTFTADMYKYYPMNKVTWYTHSHQGTDIEYWNKTTFAGQTTALFVSSKIDKVEINSNNNVYSCTITKNNENSVTSPDRMFVYEKTVTMGGVYTKDTLPRGWYANFNYHSDYLAYGPNCNPFYLAGSWATRTFSGTLTEVFEQLQKYVRNIDIYVDGVLWSKAGK